MAFPCRRLVKPAIRQRRGGRLKFIPNSSQNSTVLTYRFAMQGRGHASNEQLELIGDRVLGLIMAEWLAERLPREQVR